jgi:hypothetical protein
MISILHKHKYASQESRQFPPWKSGPGIPRSSKGRSTASSCPVTKSDTMKQSKFIIRVCRRGKGGDYGESLSFTLKTIFTLKNIAHHLKKCSDIVIVSDLPCDTTPQAEKDAILSSQRESTGSGMKQFRRQEC